MFVLYLGFIGLTAFTLGVWAFGSWLRKHPSRTNAEKSGRALHVLFSVGMVVPGAMMVILYLNFIEIDTLVAMKPLPVQPFFRAVGLIIAVPGLYLMGVSNKSLRNHGNGLDAFRLTQKIVRKNIYTYTRNPMSLGYYLWTLGLGLVSGSSFVTGLILLGFIPAHLFFLKYFEELELELRFGATYRGYKRDVPFLIPKF